MLSSLRRKLQRFKPRRLRTRILIALIMLSVPPLLILGTISSNISKDTIVRNHLANNAHNLKTASEVADLLLRNAINMHRLILANEQLRSELKASSAGERVLDVRTASRLQNVVVTNLIDTRHISSICLFDMGFHSACYGSTDANAGIYAFASSRALIPSSPWYKEAAAAKGKEVFFSYNVLQGTYSGQAFSSVKLIRDPYTFQDIGLLVINLKKTMFSAVMNDDQDSGFLVVDPADRHQLNLVYAQDAGLATGVERNESEASLLQRLRGDGYLSIGYRNETTGWTFLHVVKSGSLLKDANRITAATSVIAASIAAIAVILSLILSGSIIRPLLLIKKMMIDWSKGSGSQHQGASFEEDEIGAIGETFKRISSENEQLEKRLVHSRLKEREAELRTLQSQIKPHFLYNTLDSIYWMAVLQKNDDIAQMAVALSESFKLSLNKGKETIPVFKELKHIEHYITIQNLRFNNRFRYVENVAPALMPLEIMKLMLQPLVENAIYHGLEPKMGSGTVELRGSIEYGHVLFAVTDDGIGMEDLSAIKQGYGIGNVRERLKLYYGPGSSFAVISEAGRGTCIEIRFPWPARSKEA
ncbi:MULTISPECIES: sensor histidine kinase [unclassified Paenibacillus]|uniref:sensor histidine kinase n=1 Tax=unclassified Paenibacillus TaxID=185978 RepID=UPI00095701EF|nr:MULTISPECIES: sensor histidine kinase [unclassified Paenibacillus]ASS68614.1 sensor histidine kinase [Paenibacillus sp. RUD330]SIR64673.1 two-component system, sensor histidine kinase YesM [Paenibacillus sp. RU4X]SIR72612.1 two-component system, sensor histidine kinase YesM [Paenibacillus sp. RU4T]